MKREKGFLLIEALIAIVILSVVITASLAVMGGCLRLAKKGEDMTRGVLKLEQILFQLESEERNDLVFYGGKEKFDNGLDCEIKSEEQKADYISFYALNTHFSWNGKKEFLDLTTFLGASEK